MGRDIGSIGLIFIQEGLQFDHYLFGLCMVPCSSGWIAHSWGEICVNVDGAGIILGNVCFPHYPIKFILGGALGCSFLIGPGFLGNLFSGRAGCNLKVSLVLLGGHVLISISRRRHVGRVGVVLVGDSAVVELELVALEGVVEAVQNFAMDSA